MAAYYSRLNGLVGVGTLLPQRITGITSVSLGALFLWAAVAKALDPTDTRRILSAAVPWVAGSPPLIAIQTAEWASGSALLWGWRPRVMALVVIGIIALFTAVLFLAQRLGYQGACGCLGTKATVSEAITRNGVLICVAGTMFWSSGSGKFAMERSIG